MELDKINRDTEEALSAAAQSPPEELVVASSFCQQRTGNTSTKKTAMISLLAISETTYCRARLDSGSRTSLITDSLVRRLCLSLKNIIRELLVGSLGVKSQLLHRTSSRTKTVII